MQTGWLRELRQRQSHWVALRHSQDGQMELLSARACRHSPGARLTAQARCVVDKLEEMVIVFLLLLLLLFLCLSIRLCLRLALLSHVCSMWPAMVLLLVFAGCRSCLRPECHPGEDVFTVQQKVICGVTVADGLAARIAPAAVPLGGTATLPGWADGIAISSSLQTFAGS